MAYPFTVLWNLEDCQADPDSGVMESNKSRPPMDRVIRLKDSRQISAQAIKASARMLKYELRQLPPPLDQQAHNQAKMKVFYKQYHPKEWTHIILQLEDDQPLLKLCSSHWKAEYVMNNCLMNDRNKNGNHKGDSDNSEGIVKKKASANTQRNSKV
jgi:hypothetical protein